MNAEVEEKLDNIQTKLLCQIKKVEKCADMNSEKLDKQSKELDQHAKTLGHHSKEIESLQEKVRMGYHFHQKEDYSDFVGEKGILF